MSKKQIIKNMKKNSKENVKSEEKDTYFKFVTTLAVTLLILVLVYFLIGVFYTKEIDFKKDDKETKEDISVDNTTIMLGQLFDQNEDEYYVLVYDFDDKVLSISSWLSVYQSDDDAIKVYKVDSSKKFNNKYIVKKDSNKNASSLEDLKVISPTLIKIKDGKISDYIEGENNIVEIFKK